MDTESLTITVEEAAKALKIGRGLAYQMAREGRLPTLKFGRRLLVSKKALEQLLEKPEILAGK